MMQAVDHAEAGVSLGVALYSVSHQPERSGGWHAGMRCLPEEIVLSLHSHLRPDLIVFLGDTFSNTWV